jgi:hypothetical protein
MYNFRKGQKIKLISPCSNCVPGIIYTLGTNSSNQLAAVRDNGEFGCTCKHNWILADKINVRKLNKELTDKHYGKKEK